MLYYLLCTVVKLNVNSIYLIIKNFLLDLQNFSISIHEEKLADGKISRDFLGSLADFWLKWINVYYLDKYFFCYNIREKNDKKNISLEIVALDPREIAA